MPSTTYLCVNCVNKTSLRMATMVIEGPAAYPSRHTWCLYQVPQMRPVCC
jgi:hypothetical protein